MNACGCLGVSALPSVSLSLFLSQSLSTSLTLRPPLPVSVALTLCQPVYLSLSMFSLFCSSPTLLDCFGVSVCLSVCLPVCLSVCLSLCVSPSALPSRESAATCIMFIYDSDCPLTFVYHVYIRQWLPPDFRVSCLYTTVTALWLSCIMFIYDSDCPLTFVYHVYIRQWLPPDLRGSIVMWLCMVSCML